MSRDLSHLHQSYIRDAYASRFCFRKQGRVHDVGAALLWAGLTDAIQGRSRYAVASGEP